MPHSKSYDIALFSPYKKVDFFKRLIDIDSLCSARYPLSPTARLANKTVLEKNQA